VKEASAANGGIVFDFWHYMRSGRDDELLRRVPGEKIFEVRICDATLALPRGMSLVEDGLNNRRMAGDGEFPIDQVMSARREIGALHSFGVEVFSPKLDAMTAEEIGKISRSTLDRLLSA
jgi:sugar phosphate isomerase/epimerase